MQSRTQPTTYICVPSAAQKKSKMNPYLFTGLLFTFIMGVIALLEYGTRKGWSWIDNGNSDTDKTLCADGSAAACGDGGSCF